MSRIIAAYDPGRMRDVATFEKRVITYVGEVATISFADETQNFETRVEARRESEKRATFIIRTRDGIRADTYRIVWDGVVWNITDAVFFDVFKRYLIISCDFSEAREVTHQQSTEREYISGLPDIHTRE